MVIPIEQSFRGLSQHEADQAERIIEEYAHKLERFADDIIACRVAVEKPQVHQRTGNPFRVRLRVTIPGKELIVTKEPQDSAHHDSLRAVIRHGFEAMERQVKEGRQRRRGDVKSHAGVPVGFVLRIFREAGYGFIKTPDGREIFFHAVAVTNDDFDRLEVGTQVRYSLGTGEMGPQASTVQIVDKPGHNTSNREEPGFEMPAGWKP